MHAGGLDSLTFNVMTADIFQRLGGGVLELHELVEWLLQILPQLGQQVHV